MNRVDRKARFHRLLLECVWLFFAKGQVLLPAHEVPVLLLAGCVRGELDRVRGVLGLHGTVSRPRVQAFHREYLT